MASAPARPATAPSPRHCLRRGAPDLVRELGDLALARGVSLVDAPFSGTAADVRGGTLTVLLGADPADAARARAIVEAYADPVIHTGPPRSALQVKLLNNSLFTAISQLTLTALHAADALGVSAETLRSVLAVNSGGSKAADYIGRYGGAAEFVEAVADVLDKDVAAARRAAERSGLDLGPILRAAVDGPLPIERRRPPRSLHLSGLIHSRNVALGVGDDNPLFVSEDYGQTNRWGAPGPARRAQHELGLPRATFPGSKVFLSRSGE